MHWKSSVYDFSLIKIQFRRKMLYAHSDKVGKARVCLLLFTSDKEKVASWREIISTLARLLLQYECTLFAPSTSITCIFRQHKNSENMSWNMRWKIKSDTKAGWQHAHSVRFSQLSTSGMECRRGRLGGFEWNEWALSARKIKGGQKIVQNS